MSIDEKLEAMVRSYRFTVIALCSVIMASFIALTVILLWAVPSVVREELISVLEEYEAEVWQSN